MTDEQLLSEANVLCDRLAAFDGYAYPEDHQFHTDPSPRSQEYWRRAAVAYEVIRATDLGDLLANLGVEPVDGRPQPVRMAPVGNPRRRR